MKYIKQLCVCIVFSVLGFSVSAAPVPVYKIDKTQGTYLQAKISYDLYRYSNSPRLSDLIVMDALGNKLPYRINSTNTQHAQQKQLTSVRYFPVAEGAAPETLLALSSASIRLDDNEISVSAKKNAQQHLQDKSVPVDFYLVDLSDFRQPVDALKIDWQPSDSNQYLEVQVSGTNDLTNWAALTKATLVRLEKDGQTLERKLIELNLREFEYAYLQLRFLRGGGGLQLLKVDVENTEKVEKSSLESWEIAGQLAEEQGSVARSGSPGFASTIMAWEFEREDITPIVRVGLRLGEINYGDNIRLFSRASDNLPWQLLYEGTWFNAQVGDDWQHSEDIHLISNSDTLWRIELQGAANNITHPVLVYTRAPEILEIIANNSGPFFIAVETDPSLSTNNPNAQVFSQLITGKNPQWEQVEFTKLNPDIKQFTRHGNPISWKTILFWTMLFCAVALLLTLAIRLLKQVKHTQQTNKSLE